MKITLSIECNSVEEAHTTLERLERRVLTEADTAADLAGLPRPARIAHEDRPDVGAVSVPPVPAPIVSSDESPAPVGNPFAQGVAAAPVVPTAPTVPSPAAIAPSAATVPTAALAAGSVELDKNGLPWDGRIHADAGKGKPKPKNGDGSWRKKRGVDESVIFAVEAELRQAQAARAPAAIRNPPPAVYLSPAAAVPGGAAAAMVPVPPPVVPAPVVAPPPVVPTPPAAPAAPDSGFGPLMGRLAKLVTQPRFEQVRDEALKAFDLSALGQLAGRPDLVASFGEYFDALWAQQAAA